MNLAGIISVSGRGGEVEEVFELDFVAVFADTFGKLPLKHPKV